MPIRHKCFISYHHADQEAVDQFVKEFDHNHDIFIARRLGKMPDDIINSTNTDYVMRRIREDYIKDSTVTIVMCGKCTWARRYVDWEIQASLRSTESVTPNGLLAVKLPTFSKFPERFTMNLRSHNDSEEKGYAGSIEYPKSKLVLQKAIEWSFNRRSTHLKNIKNISKRFSNSKNCD